MIKRINKLQIILCAFFLIFGVLLYWLNCRYLVPYKVINSASLSYEKANVLEVLDSTLEIDKDANSGYRGTQKLRLEITTGVHKGRIVETTNYLTKMHNVYAEEGNILIVSIDESDINSQVGIYNYSKSTTLYLMIFVFLALMVIVGDFKGLKSAVGLIFSLCCIIFFTLPLIFNGYSPIIISIISVIIITAVTLILIDGLSKKVLIASISAACGVVLAGLLFILFGSALSISGCNIEETEALIVVSQNTGLKISQILFAGVLIGSVGAVLDVAMSISSSMWEVRCHTSGLTAGELFKSGINVGKDMIGTMSNTLILAYAGSSFATMLLFFAYSVNYNQVINMDSLIIEIAQALAGSMGIILTVPCAAYIGSKILTAQNSQGH